MPDSKDLELRNNFLRLLAKSEAAIRTFLRAILYSQSDTDEAFQNTLITLWDKFEEYDAKKTSSHGLLESHALRHFPLFAIVSERSWFLEIVY